MIEAPTEAFPLTWPTRQPRTQRGLRVDATYRFKHGMGKYRDELMDSLRKLSAKEIVLSSDVPVRNDGLPYANAREPSDPGVAVYFKRKGKPLVLACDQYTTVKANIRALGLSVEALRAIERHGSAQLLEQAFTGFAALPAHAAEPSWWDVLGVKPDEPIQAIKAKYRDLAQQHHPDRGGDPETMARINRAYETACQERS